MRHTDIPDIEKKENNLTFILTILALLAVIIVLGVTVFGLIQKKKDSIEDIEKANRILENPPEYLLEVTQEYGTIHIRLGNENKLPGTSKILKLKLEEVKSPQSLEKFKKKGSL